MRSLEDALSEFAARGPTQQAVAQTLTTIARASAELSAIIAAGAYSDKPTEQQPGFVNASGDVQKGLDAQSDAIFLEALRGAPVAGYASEEQEAVVPLKADAPLLVTIDPLDGSSNIDTNMSIGTIFSLIPVVDGDPAASLYQPGHSQLAAGFVIYGPRTAMVASWGEGTSIYALDPATRTFHETIAAVSVPRGKREYAINSSNYRHWDEHVRAYIDDCIAGADGPLALDYNMRWGASLVAEAFRIFQRGGVFLYPGDSRKTYEKGRLRLVYEANPIAFVTEQAGGAATTGRKRILDIVPQDIHQRTPLVFGSTDHVEQIGRYYNDINPAANRAPLFGTRGLLRV